MRQREILNTWIATRYDGCPVFVFDDLPDDVQSALGGRGAEFGRLQLWREAVEDYVLARSDRKQNPKQNPFMVPQYVKADVWLVETSDGTEPVFADFVGKKPDLEDFADYVEGSEISGAELSKGKYWAQLSAPGYMDQTPWGGPFDTMEKAQAYIEAVYDVDPETGEEFDENPRRRKKKKASKKRKTKKKAKKNPKRVSGVRSLVSRALK